MPITTTQVTCTFHNQQGQPVAGAEVSAQLDRTEIYQGLVVPRAVTAVADANGVAVLSLWPNALGVNGSVYRVRALDPATGARVFDANVSVPEADCLLQHILSAAPYPPLDASAQALAAAQGALALVTQQATVATTSATESSSSAANASDSAIRAADDKRLTGLDLAATHADVLATHEDKRLTGLDLAATHADVLTTQEDKRLTGLDRAAAAQAVLDAAAQAGISVMQAGLATTNGQAQVALAAEQVSLAAADRAQTHLDRVQTSFDRAQTALDRIQTAADRVQTDADKAASVAAIATTATNATAANTAAGNAAGSAAQALAVYGTSNAMAAALATAANQASLAAGYAASAGSVLQQDLSAVSAALHRSPNTVTAMFVYDTSKDSDGGAWVEKCQGTSWYNEPLNGKWLGQQDSEALARYAGALTYGAELLVSPDFDSLTGWFTNDGMTSCVISEGVATLTMPASSYHNTITQGLSVVADKWYELNISAAIGTSTTIQVGVSTSSLGTSLSSIQLINSKAIQQYQLRWKAPTTGTVYISAGYYNGSGTAFLNRISAREILAATTTTGDYFQLTTDGKFYKLNTTPGVTEVFRGTKAKFPRLAGIVLDASGPRNALVLYDLTVIGCSMWGVFFVETQNAWAAFNALVALNGVIFFGGGLGAGWQSSGFAEINLPSSSLHYLLSSGWTGTGATTKVYRKDNITTGSVNAKAVTGFQRYSAGFKPEPYSVAMCVLPKSATSGAAELPIPTIVFSTSEWGGESNVMLITPEGVVCKSQNLGTAPCRNVVFDADKVCAQVGSTWYRYNNPSLITGTFSMGSIALRDSAKKVAGTKNHIKKAQDSSLVTVRYSNSSIANSLNGVTADTHSTGHLTGDIRRAYLCDTVVESVGPSVNLVTNGTFDTDTAGWVGADGGVLTVSLGAMRVTSSVANWGAARYTLNTVIGSTYKLTARTVGKSAGGSYRIRVATDGSQNSQGLVGHLVNASTTETTSSTLFVAPASTTYLWVIATSAIGDYIEVDDFSITLAEPDRSYKAQAATIYGTLTKSQVAPGAQLVGYSGFSNVNYLREGFSADLDMGVGEWSVRGWVNVPVVLPSLQTLTLGPELITNGDFSTDANWAQGTGWAVSGGAAVATGVSNFAGIFQSVPSMNSGWVYKLVWTATVTSGTVVPFAGTSGAGGGTVTNTVGTTTITDYITSVINANDPNLLFRGNPTFTGALDSVSFKEVTPLWIIDRSFTEGTRIRVGVVQNGRLTATAFDGTTTRTVTTTSAYNTGTWISAEATYRAGKLAILVNGVEVASSNGAPLLTLNNANAVLTIGNSYNLDAPFPGSISLLKIGATVPTAEQALWIYEQEKVMFREGVQVTLPAATAVQDLTYDELTDTWTASQTGFESKFQGLARISTATPSAGSFSKVVTTNGVKLTSRITTSPGVDVTIPAYGFREELVRRGEAAAKLSKTLQVFDFDAVGFTAAMTSGSPTVTASSVVGAPYVGMGITGTGIPANVTILGINGTTYTLSANCTATASNAAGQSTFRLPMGWTTTEVLSAGASKREGATKDFVREFDGFVETIKFAVTPGSAAWVQITARKDI